MAQTPSSASQVSGERMRIAGNARFLDRVGLALVDQLVAGDHDLAGRRVDHVLGRDPAEDALGERGHHFTVVDRRLAR